MQKTALLSFMRQHRLAVISSLSSSGNATAALVGIAVTDQLELVFDTSRSSRKYQNIQQHPQVAVVIGWDNETSLQYEGWADEPWGDELEQLKTVYFRVYPDGRERAQDPDITYFRIKPQWIRYSNFNTPVTIVEFGPGDL